MSKLLNLGAGMDLTRGERCEGVKKEVCIKKQDTLSHFLCHYHAKWGKFEIMLKGDMHAEANRVMRHLLG